MSADIEAIMMADSKSLDKKEIEVEEREKMLNEENKPSTDDVTTKLVIEEAEPEIKKVAAAAVEAAAPAVTEEGREVKPKFIPIGGIKMPGFFTRNKPKEKCKDGGDDGAHGELLEKQPDEAAGPKDGEEKDPTKKNLFKSFKFTNPFFKEKKPADPSAPPAEEADKPLDNSNQNENPAPKKGLLNAIRLPIANMTQRLRSHRGAGAGGDAESGLDATKQAELASMETLDDNKEVVEKTEKSEDGMETVKLDVEDKPDGDEPKEKLHWRERIRQQKFIIDDLAIAGGVLLFIILLIIIIAITASSGSALRVSPLKDGRYVDAVTSCGLVEGKLEDGAIAFRGIPYAIPPTGENRWRAAQPLNRLEMCWNETMKVHNSTPTCMQIHENGTVDGEEDCLTLDVITPEVRYENPLPVVVLIGSNTLIGDTPGKLRPSTRYARSKDVIFVRPNYRVGSLGFLYLDILSKSTYPIRSGNYGLTDIIAALKWVQLNIVHFGGDPKSVVLFGHRAGATLVTALLGYKNADTLFARAWISSGSALFPGKLVEDDYDPNKMYLDLIKCNDVVCMKKAEAKNIVNAVPDTWRSSPPDLPSLEEEPDKRHEWLVLDGLVMNSHAADVIQKSKIPVVIGTTAHVSASQKLFMKYDNWTSEVVTKHIKESKIGQMGLTEEVLKKYNATYKGLSSIISDIRTVCPLLTLSRKRDPNIPFYIVTQGSGENDIANVDSDISAILGRYEPKTPEQRRYVAAMQQLFYHYVWHGVVLQTKNNNYVLDIGQDVLPVGDYENCNFWIEKDVVPRYGRQD